MNLYLSIYKKQISFVLLTLVLGIALFNVIQAGNSVIIFILLGAILSIFGISMLIQYLQIPPVFRSIDIKFFVSGVSLLVGLFLIISSTPLL